MRPTGYILIALILSILWLVLRRDFQRGLSLAFGFIIALPSYLAISLPGALPELTIQRLILPIVLIYYLKVSTKRFDLNGIPLIKPIMILVLIQFASMMFSVNSTSSLKNFISFNIETILFFIIISNSISSKNAFISMVQTACLSLSSVALIACIERYAGVNLSEVITGVQLPGDALRTTVILSTFPHRIPLGYAMAIGFTLQFVLARLKRNHISSILSWGQVILLSAVCYFSDSRGAWLGILISALSIGICGGRSSRKALMTLGAIAFVLLILRPGVQQAIMNRYYSTISEDAIQGHSYRYRWLLWNVAWSEISQSPIRLLFGYGGLSTEVMDLSHYFEAGSGGSTAKLGYTSWDNQFAATMVEFGILGFVAELVVYANALWLLANRWKHANGANRELHTAILTSVIIYLFAMTNVYMFSDQLRFLFWGLLALGCNLNSLNDDALKKFKLLLVLRSQLLARQHAHPD
jgi:hypothetical protein